MKSKTVVEPMPEQVPKGTSFRHHQGLRYCTCGELATFTVYNKKQGYQLVSRVCTKHVKDAVK